jgi:outer membrane protein assembly factor BamA
VTFTDVLGDQQFNLFAESVSQYRSLSLSYLNLSRRFQYALQGFSQTQFYYGAYNGLLYSGDIFLDRDQALATQTLRGGAAFGIYPINRYSRFELSAGLYNFNQRYNDEALQAFAEQFQIANFGQRLFVSGTIMPFGAAYVRETTVFREYGPLSGDTMRLAYDYAPPVGGFLSRQSTDLDARKYIRLATNGVLAFRFRGFKSWGQSPGYLYYGGNSEMRGYDYLEFLGHKAFFANAELRFPLIEAALTPIGVIGGLRAVAFADLGAAGFNGRSYTVATRSPAIVPVITGFVEVPQTQANPQGIAPVVEARAVSGLRLVDGRASYGLGLETFALGFPIHFDWSWRTLLNRDWEDSVFAFRALQDGESSGSRWLRRPKFSVWIGYDF